MSADDRVPDAEWFEQLAERSGVIFYVLRIQPDVAFEYLGAALLTRLGVPPDADTETILGRVDPDFADRMTATLSMAPGDELSMDLTWNHLDGRRVHSRAWFRVRSRPDGSVIQEGIVLDVTEQHEVESDLRRSEERNRLLAENAWDVIWTMALDGKITYVNPAVERVRGITAEEAMLQTPEEINPPESAATVAEHFQKVFAAIQAGTDPPNFRGEIEYYRRDGSIMTGELQVIANRDASGQVVELIGVTRDISERKVFEAELRDMAVTDTLTGVWNRRHGTDLATADLSARRTGAALTLLMLDIDNFKTINDNFGHQSGDHVLIETASRLRRSLRGSDMVARWGGEEFVVLLRDCALPEALQIAEDIRASIAEVAFGPMGRITVSIGAAEARDNEDLQSWLSRADQALYRAKHSGRNTVAAENN
jgi:diguanylate cyclase (GGDEF)-like protein/PAS domain S-box-containing protein